MSKRLEALETIYQSTTEKYPNVFRGPVNTYPEKDLEDKRAYSFVTMIPRVVDIMVKLYSEKYILVKYNQGRRSYHRVYTSPQDTIDFIVKMFVEHDEQGAMSIPTK